MEQWDEDKLKTVVEKKHGEGNRQHKTDIVSYAGGLCDVTLAGKHCTPNFSVFFASLL